MKKDTIPPAMINKAVERLRALSDSARLNILLRLRQGESNVTSLVKEFGIAQASVSKHLAILKQVGFVQVRRDGSQSMYSIKDDSVFDVVRLICDGVHKHQTELAEAIGLDSPNWDI